MPTKYSGYKDPVDRRLSSEKLGPVEVNYKPYSDSNKEFDASKGNPTTSVLGNATAHLNKETERGEHRPSVGGYHDHNGSGEVTGERE